MITPIVREFFLSFSATSRSTTPLKDKVNRVLANQAFPVLWGQGQDCGYAFLLL